MKTLTAILLLALVSPAMAAESDSRTGTQHAQKGERRIARIE